MAQSSSQDNISIIPENPFPGLRPFKTSEAHLFFGRRRQADEIYQTLLANRFCAVTGASGSGKSSLIYCGIITALENNDASRSDNWKILISRPGNSPVVNLLNKLKGVSGKDVSFDVSRPPDITRLFKDSFPDNNKILIIIDQFEEVFRYSDKEQQSEINSAFLYTQLLTELVKQNEIPIYLIITMRSDFIGECSKFLELTSLINSSNYLVPRMTRDDFREVIEGPVKVAGAKIEEKLVETMLHDLGDNPDQLPVLQHALMRTWSYWSLHNDINKPLVVSDYEAIGRLEKALSEHANEAYDELNEKEKEACEKIFRTLTEKGTDNKGVRKPARVDKLAEICLIGQEEVIKILDVFRLPGRSFITPSAETHLKADTVADISHESFMRIWDRLRAWVDEEAAAVQMYKRLAESAMQYQSGRSGLWRPPDLQLAINWRKKTKPTLAWAERYNPAFERTMVFLSTSESQFLKEEENKLRLQKRQLRRTRIFALVLGSAAIISLGLFVWTRELQVKAEKEFQRAETQRMLAEQKTIEAQEQSELAKKAAEEAREQRAVAEDQSKIAEEQRIQAEKNALEARRQTALATKNLSEANHQRSIALTNEKEANLQREQAEKAKNEAFQRRMLSTAKSMSVKSVQTSTDANLRALLAYQAFVFYDRFNGPLNDVDIYTGLYQSLKFLLGTTYNVYNGHTDAVRSVVFVPGSSSFISAGSEGSILKWDLTDKDKKFSTITEGRNIIEIIRVSADGKKLICSESRNGILIFNLENIKQQPVLLSGTDNNIRAVAVSPDNRTMFTTGMNNTIDYWNLDTGKSLLFVNTESRVNALSLSPDGILLAGGTRDGKLTIWRTKSETISSEIFNDPANPVQSLAFSPDFKFLAAGNMNGDIKIFQADNFNLVRILSGHNARITDIGFSADGQTMASSSYDGNVLYWNMNDLTSPPVILNDHSGFVFSVAFSSDGNYMISGSSEGDKLIVRPVYSKILADQICGLVTRDMTIDEWNTYVGDDIPYEETCKIQPKKEIEIRVIDKN